MSSPLTSRPAPTNKIGRLRWVIPVIGGLITCGALIRNVWTSDDDLIQIKGQLRSANVYVSTVRDRYDNASQRCDLIFFIDDGKQKYQLNENIGDAYYDEKYQQIRQRLQKADSISVWIRKTEENVWQPKIFQIKSDETVLVSSSDTRDVDGKSALIIAIPCLLLATVGIAFSFPAQFRQILTGGKNSKDT